MACVVFIISSVPIQKYGSRCVEIIGAFFGQVSEFKKSLTGVLLGKITTLLCDG